MKLLLTHTPRMRDQYYGSRALAALRAVGEVRLHEADDPLDPAALARAAGGVDLVVADRATAVPAEVLAALPDLRAVLRVAVDISTIDVAAASAAGILVTRARPGFVAAVTELALGFLVDLSRGISRTTADYQAGRRPEALMGRQLAGSTAGIIGYGAIGRNLGPLLARLGMTVLVSDPHVRVTEPGLSQVGFGELLARADYVICLAVATEATENLIDAAAIAHMRPDAVLLNLARGNLVDEAALAAALREGRLAGAALDVGRAPDQMPSRLLAALPQVVATPHVGGLTPPAIEAQAMETAAQAAALARGEVPDGAVNPEHWTRRPPA
ncbi:Glyoxylate/hydroxypyruvate reductase B [Methylobacterium crusticola]|uniref:Glyoxylate/hydroxypyruvate reductase B n=1 Tax=Methylobacterium crusticola TaxID=1697972 RepID=A0ABQ4QVZ3_9HYPH|nr:NAD(P)-dependent oxidoreductase [Methylobacterium crusticola]GJD49516.1 Glyoxylate/hydroxypyruvate reductase B [Methylobacterium crusticola]